MVRYINIVPHRGRPLQRIPHLCTSVYTVPQKQTLNVSRPSGPAQKIKCLVGESNPGQLLGRQLCYLYTNEAEFLKLHEKGTILTQ